MKVDAKRKMYMGIWLSMFPVPMAISTKGMNKGVSGARTKADLLSREERKVHHFVVKQMATSQAKL